MSELRILDLWSSIDAKDLLSAEKKLNRIKYQISGMLEMGLKPSTQVFGE